VSLFRTIEVSDPAFECDHLRFITVKSVYLRGRGDICVFAPPSIDNHQTIPVVILLHGVYGSAWSWAYSGGVHRHALEMMQKGIIPPMIIAMPSDGLWGDGSAFLKHNGYNFEKWIAEDIVAALLQVIPGVKKDAPLFLAGLSMGGFGALRIGARYGNLFKAVSAHSAITSLEQMELFAEEPVIAYAQADKTDEDVCKTFERYRHQLPPVRFDCGLDDPLIEYNRLLHRRLEELKIDHIYEEFPGAHEWSYWQKHIRNTLLFFSRQL
jgi:enterochelin esterase-like enzyme